MTEITSFVYLFAGYLFGSLSSAIITCKLMGLADPRTVGSKNPGATNVLRYGGKKAAIFTLTGDVAKGLIPVLIARFMDSELLNILLAGFGAFIGHLFPLFFKFKGGKGVATYFGVLFALTWQIGLIALAIWLTIAYVLRISSLSALVTSICVPAILFYQQFDTQLILVLSLMSLLLIWRHKSNIKNLLEGKESQIGKKEN